MFYGKRNKLNFGIEIITFLLLLISPEESIKVIQCAQSQVDLNLLKIEDSCQNWPITVLNNEEIKVINQKKNL